MSNNYSKAAIWDRSKAANYVLSRLWSDAPYDEGMRIVFNSLFPFQLEEFLADEIFLPGGVIRLLEGEKLLELDGREEEIFMSLSALEKDFLWKLVLLYFLHSRHNKALMRCQPDYYNMEQQDTFLSGCIIHAGRTYAEEVFESVLSLFQNRDKSLLLDRDGLKANLGDFIYGIARRSSFVLLSGSRQAVITPKYNGDAVFSFTVEAEKFRDDSINDYAEYISYICTKERNHIADFPSIPALWMQAVKTPRAGSLLHFRPSDRELQRLIICLGLTIEVYHKLQHLRDVYPEFEFQKQAKKVGTRSKSAKEVARERMIEDFMRNAPIRLHVITSSDDGKIPEQIPRLLLVRATVDLVREGFSGLVSLSDEEIASLNLSGKEEQRFRELYAGSGTRRIKEKK